ncbi:MAG: DegT/DnrJ/EryC1/StrS family aminotransferase [Elusimicrobia bacterium]|nr:DegT/DnrJ/EryC1/StrS family aminotransferase [Elusimicrobiota bacterium]
MIPHNRPALGTDEEKALSRVMRSGWIVQGEEVAAFENEICRYLGLSSGHAVAVSSGSAALYLALWSLQAADKTVAFPSYVCAALRHATALAGGRELVLDTAPESPNIAARTLTSCGAEIAIVPHMFGLPIDLSGAEGVDIVEDCAQALGAKVNGARAGLQGRLGVFSFYATKLMTSGGQGGMVVSKDKDLVTEIRDYRQFDGRRDDKKRFNFQMTDLEAAVGRVQLKRLPEFLHRREEIFEQYREAGLDLIDIPPTNYKKLQPVRYRAVVRTEDPHGLIKALGAKQIRAIVPVADWELLGDAKACPDACELSRKTVSLPLFPSLTDKEVHAVIEAAQ